MVKKNSQILQIIQNLSWKSDHDMMQEEKEWHDVCTLVIPFIVQKYKVFPYIKHNADKENTKNCKLPDFEFITTWSEEIPEWYYEHTRITWEYDHTAKKFWNPSKQELIEKININYTTKDNKKYISLTWVRWLIFSGARVDSKFQPLDILKHFRSQNGNFDILIFCWCRSSKYSYLLIYQKKSDIGYEIHIESWSDKFVIHKDIKVDFLTDTFHDRILTK